MRFDRACFNELLRGLTFNPSDCYDLFASAFAILNPLIPKSDHHLLSPYSNTVEPSFRS